MLFHACTAALACVLAAAAANEAPGATHVTIVADGASTWRIHLPAEHAPAMRYAANELQALLERISGARLPIDTGGDAPGPDAILLRLTPDDARLAEDGVAIRIDPAARQVVLAGQNERAVVYSVYALLERHLGVRFLAKDCTILPERATVALPAEDYVHTPPFMYRETLYFDSFPKQIAVRQRLNGPRSECDEEVGGKWAFQPYVHSFCELVPAEQYFEEHPEYYSLQGGVRKADRIHAQLCLTNPEVLEIATQTVLRWIEEYPDVPIIDVSQNDGNGWCECEACMAIVEEEGSQHGPILRFVNAIADVVAEKHPDKWIETLAYAYSTKPPEHTMPRDNVIIRLCHAGCYFHGFEKCGLGANLTTYLDAWAARTRRIFIWHYATNFAHYIAPNQNLGGLAADIRYYAAHGVNGLMVQANYQGSCGDLSELRQYLAARLMWDPALAPEDIVTEFCEGYYGPAAAAVIAYLARLDRAAQDPDVHAFGAWDPRQTASPELVGDGLLLIDQAYAAAQDAPYRERVERLYLPLWYMQLAFGETYGLDPLAAGDLVARFARIAQRDGATHINEGRAMDDWINEMRGRYAEAAPADESPAEATPPPTSDGAAHDAILPSQE